MSGTKEIIGVCQLNGYDKNLLVKGIGNLFSCDS